MTDTPVPVTLNIAKVAAYIFDRIGGGTTEFYIFQDGEYGSRLEGSFSPNESEVVGKLNLTMPYWRDTLAEWELLDEENDCHKEDCDEGVRQNFLKEHIYPYLSELPFEWESETTLVWF
ncbi:TPA: hypothetical protein ACGOVI_001366 [Streptococcus suis]